MEERREHWLVSDQFLVIRVRSLPYAHNPSRCAHSDRFEQTAGDGASGRRFFDGLTEQDFASCHYHQLCDWRLAAKASVDLFRAHRDDDISRLDETLSRLRLGRVDLRAVQLLFHDPIVWDETQAHVVNGQHRICAMRAAGVRLCVIDYNRLDLSAPPGCTG